MKTFKLPYTDTEISIDENNIICNVNSFKDINYIIEMKLSEYVVKDLEKNSPTFPYWLDMIITELGTSLIGTEEEFEKVVRENWEQWNTEEVLIGNQLSYYQIGNKFMAHDMKDYYGPLRSNGDLFQRRYDFAIPDIEIKLKEEEEALIK